MTKHAWVLRLNAQLDGWHVWYTSGPGPKWNAVPAPSDINHIDAVYLPNRLSAATPQGLRKAAQLRYGWNDYCQTCGVIARECGHRQPETRSAP